MAGRDPEHHVCLPVVQQQWRDMVFLHWPYPAEVIGRYVPDGFEVDTFDGQAWLGLTPFRVAACSPGLVPPLGLWSFPETNLRTYVVGPDGRDGLWFLSIEADDIPITVGARFGIGAPYHLGAMSVGPAGSGLGLTVRYRSRRRGVADTGHDIRIRVGDRLADTARTQLVDWFTGRWRAWTTWAGAPLWSPVQHEPWPLHHAEVEALEQTLTAAVGLPPPSGEPLAHFSPGVDARLGAARPVLRR